MIQTLVKLKEISNKISFQNIFNSTLHFLEFQFPNKEKIEIKSFINFREFSYACRC